MDDDLWPSKNTEYTVKTRQASNYTVPKNHYRKNEIAVYLQYVLYTTKYYFDIYIQNKCKWFTLQPVI